MRKHSAGSRIPQAKGVESALGFKDSSQRGSSPLGCQSGSPGGLDVERQFPRSLLNACSSRTAVGHDLLHPYCTLDLCTTCARTLW